MQGGAVHQKKRSLFPGHVRKPSHHGGLQEVKFVMAVPVDDPRTSATPIFFGDCEWSLFPFRPLLRSYGQFVHVCLLFNFLPGLIREFNEYFYFDILAAFTHYHGKDPK